MSLNKTFFRFLTRTIIFCVALSIQANAHAGGPAAGGSSEWTQVLNWMELVEQKTTSAATLIATINTLDIAIRNAIKNPLGLLGQTKLFNSLNKIMSNLQDIGDSMSEIDARWEHAYMDPEDPSRKSTKFKLANDKTLMAAKGALKIIAEQRKILEKSVEDIQGIRSGLSAAIGTNQFLSGISEATLAVADIALSIHATLESQSATLATFVAGQASIDQTSRDVNGHIIGFKEEKVTPTTKELKLNDFITKPEKGIFGN